MHALILKYLSDLRASYWFVPSVMSLCAAAMSFVLTTVDQQLTPEWMLGIDWLYANEPAGARALLSTIAGSMITVAGVTFSMTIVAVSFAASQLGPRLVSNFMRDRSNQITLGTFIGTFIYCLLVLRTVRDGHEVGGDYTSTVAAFVPQSAILFGIASALVSVAVLINFIHHIPESINVSNIAARLGKDLMNMVDDLFPSQIGEPASSSGKEEPTGISGEAYIKGAAVKAEVDGYIQVLNEDALMRVANTYDIVIRVEYRPGNFVTVGKTLLLVSPPEKLNDEVTTACRKLFAFGDSRTPRQNILFSIDQMVEIIARALSPGVNDPFTAISCIDWLQAMLNKMLPRAAPSPFRYDEEGNLRVVTHPVTFEGALAATLDQIRPYACSDRIAALRILKMIGELLIDVAPDDEREKQLLDHASQLNDAAQQTLPVLGDREDVQDRHDLLYAMVKDVSLRNEMRDSNTWLEGTA